MKNNLMRKFLLKVCILFGLVFCMPAFAASSNVMAVADIGEYGAWNTENNREIMLSQVGNDMNAISSMVERQTVASYVPVESKVGLAFMNAFTHVADVLNNSLGVFVSVFISIAFGLWLMLEGYNIMIGKDTINKKLPDILKHGIAVAVWVGVLSIGPGRVFGFVLSPIMMIGRVLSDTVLDSVGAFLPDTCSAIGAYVASEISPNNILDVNAATNLLCVPSMLSGLCYTAISAGWKWMSYGIGNSIVAFFCGLFFVGGFIYLGWKFAFMAFGVVAELFIGIIMLPFTAIAEATKKTSYKGIAGDVYNGFLDIFKAEDLKTQIGRLVNVVLHFFVLSILIAICFVLLSGIIDTNTGNRMPNLNDSITYVEIMVAALTFWLAKNASKIATQIGGKIDHKMGDDLEGFADGAIGNMSKYATKASKKVAKHGLEYTVEGLGAAGNYLKNTMLGKIVRNTWNKGTTAVNSALSKTGNYIKNTKLVKFGTNSWAKGKGFAKSIWRRFRP